MDAADILSLYQSRRANLADAHAKFRDIRAVMLNEVDLPLPELDRNERPAVANLALTGLEQTAGRIASTMPDVFYPPVRPGIARSEDLARKRRMRTKDWYDKNNMRLILQRRARHYLTYAAAPVVIRPHPTDDYPMWDVRDPLATYAAEMPIGQVVPDDVIFAYTRSYGWLSRRYLGLEGLSMANRNPDQQLTVLEYVDSNEFSTFVMAPETKPQDMSAPLLGIGNTGFGNGLRKPPGVPIVQVGFSTNSLGRPLCVVAGRISLERAQSAYEGITGFYLSMAKLMALEVIGMQKMIWPETWLEPLQAGALPKIITPADPIAGVTGQVQDGRIQVVNSQPNQLGMNLIDRQERNMRISGGIPAEYGGESGTNIRTDRRGNSVLSAATDFPIQQAQVALEVAMREENEIGRDIEKKFFGAKTISFYSPTQGKVTYQPNQLWEDEAINWVKYSHAGVDESQLVVENGQKVGIGAMSIRSFMEDDPSIDDPEMELERIRFEKLEGALLGGMAAQLQQDPSYSIVVARVIEQLRQDSAPDIAAAILAADDWYKQQQAQQQQQPPAQGTPEAQPGMAAPNSTIPAPGPDMTNLSQMLQEMRHTSRSPVPAGAGMPSQLMGATAGP